MQRVRIPELMDNPNLDPGEHSKALRGLARIHRLTGTANALAAVLHRRFQDEPAQPRRILDLACGGGDLAIALARCGERLGHCWQIDGCDLSPHAVHTAQRLADSQGIGATFFEQDLLRNPWPSGYDAVTCSLFLHHLDEPNVVRVLKSACEAVPFVAIQDLRRGRGAKLLTGLSCMMITTSRVVHVDSVRSVSAAWTPAELSRMANQAGMLQAQVRSQSPFRMMLTWRRGL